MSKPRGRNRSRFRAHGRLRHYAGCAWGALTLRNMLARSRGPMQKRILAVAGQRLRARVPPTGSRMAALVATPGGGLSWKGVPTPVLPGPQGAIVRPIAIATCDMDPLIALGASPFPLPVHMGHECVAEVLSVGHEVATVRAGQRVVVPFQISCGACPACADGRTGNCQTVPSASMYGFGLTGGLWGGAVAEQLAVPFADAMLVPLPKGLEPAAAASVADNIVDAYRHIGPHLPELMRRHGAADVLILGALRGRERYSGSVPLYISLIARALGADRVLLADARGHVRDHAARLGIQAIPPQELTVADSAPLVVDASAREPGLARALTFTLPDGICSSLGGLHRSARIPMFQSYAANVTLHISRVHARAVIPSVLDLMATGRLAPELVTTTVARFEDAPAALREHYRAGGIKTVLTAY